jgi:hypothetical protein
MKPSLRAIKARGYGIVALELARTADQVRLIRRAWGPEGDAAARRSILADFAFVAGYGGFLVTAACWCGAVLRHRRSWGWMHLAYALAIAFAVAAACDVLENIGMLAELRTPEVVPGRWPPVVGSVARVKFGLLAAGALPFLTVVFAVIAGNGASRPGP